MSDTVSSPRPRVAAAADHGGFALKETLVGALRRRGCGVLDLGAHTADSVDYPALGEAVARALLDGRADFGVLACGTGIGMGIAANRRRGIRAAVCHNAETARLARAHNDANILVLGGRIVDARTAIACLDAFLRTSFEGGRHARRVAQLDRAVAVEGGALR